MPGGFAPRFALETAFLVLLGVGAGIAELRTIVIVAARPGLDDAGEAGTAQAGGNIAAREGQAGGGQLIEMGRLNVRLPLKAVVAGALIVGDYEDDIRLLGLSSFAGAERSRRSEQQSDDELGGESHGLPVISTSNQSWRRSGPEFSP